MDTTTKPTETKSCETCHAPLLVENLGGGLKSYKCESCGIKEVRDSEQRKLLLG